MAKSSPVSPSVSPARRVAFEILLRVEEGAYASILLANRESELSPLDRALCHELVMGVLRWQFWLDKLVEHYANRKVARLDPGVRLILRLGLYQLRFLSRVPASAAVNESVKLVNFARLRSAGGLVNAVLRRATREPNFDPTSAIDDPIEKIAVATSHPVWLIDRWVSAFGAQQAEAFARSNNEPATVAFRVVNSRPKSSDVVGQLREAGAELSPSIIAAGAWRITGAAAELSKLAAEGRVYVQDEASQLVAEGLQAQTGHRVLDLCAAPGGKTTQIADGINNAGVIVAADIHDHRLRTVIQAAQSQQLSSIHCVAINGLQPLPLFESAFDRVLVDAPCSGTGTLRRNPEIRWRITPADIHDLSDRQKRLLFNAAGTVKPGGRLVYSTCSVEIEENEDVRQAFLENNRQFRPVELALDPALTTSPGTARTWPNRDGTDGFFISAFERKGD
ncbi:MAG TPA: 16S rRNA (cytosine(967)-C(5))-methyltransferase RsmB [Pyrinomonadaceae bacterium]|nr:16S rRNA (cytosine(967)-C(5))-methyltransferase RsmB [Pyrinomonadaceae bacterium]